MFYLTVDEEEVVSSNYFPKNFDQEQCLANTDNNENNMTEELITNMKQLEEENSMLKVKFYELEAKMDLVNDGYKFDQLSIVCILFVDHKTTRFLYKRKGNNGNEICC